MGSVAADEAKPPRATISHVIFDMDGLLLGIFLLRAPHLPPPLFSGLLRILFYTEGFYTQVQQKILARYGKVFDWSIKAKMMGKTTAESTRIFFKECGLDGLLTPEEFLKERESMLQELLPTCSPMPGVRRLIQHLHANGIPLCVATGTHKHHFAVKTQNHQEMFSLMHHIVTGDDPEVTAGKPCPDIFLTAMRRFEVVEFTQNVEPSNCLVFEDSPLGVAAAKTAGMNVVMVPDTRLDVSYHKEADQGLNSLLDFNPSEWGMPPFND
ncbi:hypothetical protein EJB05_08551, partial [Eragrostis curvula]